MDIPDEAAAELGRSIAEAILDPKNPPRFRVERWVVDHGWVCVAKESERGWAEVAAYTGLVLYDGDYRIVDTKARTCEYYRRGGMTNSNEARETGGKLMSEPKVVFEAVPSRWVIEYQNPGQDWEFIERKPTLEAAKEYAQQSMDYASADSAALWRVVDTQPEEVATGRWNVEDVITGDQIAEVAAVGANLQWSKPSDLAEMSINAHQLTVPLTLDTYQQQAKATAVYPDDQTLNYLVAGLAGEVGELASIFAKHWRGDGDLNHDHATAELGDVLWFIAMLTEWLDTDLSTVAQGNLDKLADRANRGKLKGNGDDR